MSRILCVGDIHGGLYALQQLMVRANVTTNDKLIFLGDYIDGWETSFETIQFLIELNKTHDCIFIKGNHDVWLEDYLRNKLEPQVGHGNHWSDRGGESTMLSYVKNKGLENIEHYNFLRDLKPYHIDDKNRLFVHGGYTSIDGVEDTERTDLWWDRDLLEIAINHHNRYKGKPSEYERNYPKILKKYSEIFIGHTTTQTQKTIKPICAVNLVNIDTGAGHTNGVLTMIDVDNKNYWQSDRMNKLYPLDPHNNFMSHIGKNFN